MNTSLKAAVIALAGVASLASMGTASAQQRPTNASDYYGYYQQNGAGSANPYSSDVNRYDRSGSRGRDGLGASPYHPEGPGNPRG